MGASGGVPAPPISESWGSLLVLHASGSGLVVSPTLMTVSEVWVGTGPGFVAQAGTCVPVCPGPDPGLCLLERAPCWGPCAQTGWVGGDQPL